MTVAGATPGAGSAALQAVLQRTARESRHALVLSGGGANGAYEVGVVRALAEGASAATGYTPLSIQVFSGTSVGAYNAAFLAQQDWTAAPQAAHALDEVWRDRVADTLRSCGNGVYRLRLDPWRWVDPACLAHPLNNLVETAADSASLALYGLVYGLRFLTSDQPARTRWSELLDVEAFFSNAPFSKLLADTIDLDRLARSPSDLKVVATDWLAGTAHVFDKAQIVAELGTTALLASAAIPGLFPPVSIGGRPYVDGAVQMNTPLQPAIAAGADVLHAVYVDPEVADIPNPKLPYTLNTFYRVYVMVIAARMNNDIFTLGLINEDLELAGRLHLETSDPRLVGLPILQRIVQRLESGTPYRPLVVHRYRPKVPLSDIGGLLDFRASYVDEIIAQGYEDTIAHDCRVAQCILPPAQAVAAGLRS